jgi:hypothetical protein
MNYGKMTPSGFQSGQPDVEGLLKDMGLTRDQGENGTGTASALTQERKQAQEDLLKNYVKTFNTPAGKKVLENLLDLTLRRGLVLPAGGIEETAMYARERAAVNALMVHILGMIQIGSELPAPEKKKK